MTHQQCGRMLSPFERPGIPAGREKASWFRRLGRALFCAQSPTKLWTSNAASAEQILPSRVRPRTGVLFCVYLNTNVGRRHTPAAVRSAAAEDLASAILWLPKSIKSMAGQVEDEAALEFYTRPISPLTRAAAGHPGALASSLFTTEYIYKERVKHQLSCIAPRWDAMEVTHSRFCDELLQQADLKPGEKVLDAACGTGHLAIEAATLVGLKGIVVGMDLSSAMLSKAQDAVTELGLMNVELLEGDIETVKAFNANCFDVIFLSSALPWMHDIDLTLKRFRRWLKPGGRFFCNTPVVIDPVFEPFQSAVRKAMSIDIEDPAERVGSEAKLRNKLQSAGFFFKVEVHTSSELLEWTLNGRAEDFAKDQFKLSMDSSWIPLHLDRDELVNLVSQSPVIEKVFCDELRDKKKADGWTVSEEHGVVIPMRMLWASAAK